MDNCSGGGMVDAEDLKSFVSNDVRVRVPPRAPFLWFLSREIFCACLLGCLKCKMAPPGGHVGGLYISVVQSRI